MKKTLSIFALILSMAACKAQTYPLNTFFEDVPDYSYMKDMDNFLPPYVGTYKSTYQGNEITLYITKEDHLLVSTSGTKKYYQDVLHMTYIIKELSTGSILQDTRYPADPKRNKIISIGTYVYDGNCIAFTYSGTNCAVGSGIIKLKKISDDQVSWCFYPDSSLLTEDSCPGSLDIKVYLPVTEHLIFTKQ